MFMFYPIVNTGENIKVLGNFQDSLTIERPLSPDVRHVPQGTSQPE
jgi:hypothetical protein